MSIMIFNLRNMDEQGKEDLMHYLKEMLVAQACAQHMEICKEWTHGNIAEWHISTEDDYPDGVVVNIRYEDNTYFRYYKIDHGAEGMIVKEGVCGNDA